MSDNDKDLEFIEFYKPIEAYSLDFMAPKVDYASLGLPVARIPPTLLDGKYTSATEMAIIEANNQRRKKAR